MEIAANIGHLPMVFARNQVIVWVNAADEAIVDRSGLTYHLQVYKPKALQSAEFEVYVEISGSEVPPYLDSDAMIYEGWKPDISTFLDGLLEWVVPDRDITEIEAVVGMVTPYKVKTWIENNGVMIDGSTNELPISYAIKGKLNENQFPVWGSQFFSSYLDSTMKFLTWQPNEVDIDRNMPVFLSFLVNFLPKPESIRLVSRLTYDDDSTEIRVLKTLSSVSQYSMIQIGVGFAALGLEAIETSVGKEIFCYEVWLVNEVDMRVSEMRKYFVTCEPERQTRYLIFNNGLGGFDTLRVTGEVMRKLKMGVNLAERALEPGYVVSSEEVFVTSRKGERLLTVYTGYNENSDWIDYMEEMAWAERFRLVTKEGYLPLVPLDGEFAHKGDAEYIAGREWSFKESKEALAYSDLPVGSMPDERPTAWIPENPYCLIDDGNGFRTGYRGAAKLRLYYVDVNPPQRVAGVGLKNNVPGTEGYVPPMLSDLCAIGTAAFTNVLLSKEASFTKNDCAVGTVGTVPTIVIPAGTFGGSTLVEANQRAEAEYKRLNTQAYANANGTCEISPENYVMAGIPAGRWNWRWRVDVSLSSFYVQTYRGSDGALMGNGWHIQGASTTPPNEIFAPGTNDLKLLCSLPAGFNRWRVGVYGSAAQYRVRTWVNGVLHKDVTANPAEIEIFTGAYVIPDGARVYVVVSAV